MDPLPLINKVFSLILQEEQQCRIGSHSSSGLPGNSVAYAVKHDATKFDVESKPGKKDRPLCAHCGILGHTKDRCYWLHGFPHGYGKSKGKPPPTWVHNVSDQDSSSS